MGHLTPRTWQQWLGLAWDLWDLEPRWRTAVLVALVGTVAVLCASPPPAPPPSGAPPPGVRAPATVGSQALPATPPGQGNPAAAEPPLKKIRPAFTEGVIQKAAPLHEVPPGRPDVELAPRAARTTLKPSIPALVEKETPHGSHDPAAHRPAAGEPAAGADGAARNGAQPRE